MRTKAKTPPEAEAGLQQLRHYTWMMREHQEQIVRLGEMRRALVLELRTQTPERKAVTYRALAEAMDVSQQAVWKIIGDGEPPEIVADEPRKTPTKKAVKRVAPKKQEG